MYQALPEILEPLEELESRLRSCRDSYQKPRLQLLVLLARGEVSSREEAGERLAYHRNTIGRWLRQYQEQGLEGLLQEGQRGHPGGIRVLPEQALVRLAERLKSPQGMDSYHEVQQWLEDEYGQKLPYSTVHNWVHNKLQIKLKRSIHPQKT